jgi:hypothetical protein
LVEKVQHNLAQLFFAMSDVGENADGDFWLDQATGIKTHASIAADDGKQAFVCPLFPSLNSPDIFGPASSTSPKSLLKQSTERPFLSVFYCPGSEKAQWGRTAVWLS